MEQATEELAHSLEELANGVAAHAERRIQIVGVRDNDLLLVAAADALAFGVDAVSMLLHNVAAVFADDLMSAVAVVHIGPVVAHVVALGLLCTAGDADAILVVAGDVCGNNCTAVSADNVVSAVAVVHILPVVFHVVAGVLSTASAGALAVLTVNTLSSVRHNCTAVFADDLVSAVAVVLVLEGAVVALMTAASAGGLALIVDVSGGIDDSTIYIADVRAGAVAIVNSVLLAVVALMTAASAGGLALIVDVSGGIDDSTIYIADVRAGAVAIVNSVLLAVVASRLFCVAANTNTVLIPDVSLGIDDISTLIADVRAGTIAVVDTGLIDMLTLCSSESSRSHGQNHCACQHGGQKAAELFQFHKTDLLYTTKFLILPRAASQFIHAWTAGASHFRNILRVVQWFTLGLPLL